MEKGYTRGTVKLGASALVMLFATVSLGYAEEIRIANLRSSGWTEIEKREQTTKLPGVPPYRKLIRIIQTTHYLFQKEGKQIACWISYDSQRDKISEECSYHESRSIIR